MEPVTLGFVVLAVWAIVANSWQAIERAVNRIIDRDNGETTGVLESAHYRAQSDQLRADYRRAISARTKS